MRSRLLSISGNGSETTSFLKVARKTEGTICASMDTARSVIHDDMHKMHLVYDGLGNSNHIVLPLPAGFQG